MSKPNCPAESRDEHCPSPKRRTLLKAGWVVPVVVAVSLPAVSFDANASGRVRQVPQPPRVTLPPQPPSWWPPRWPWPPFGG